MIAYYKTTDSGIARIAEPLPGCWIDVVNPTEAERRLLLDELCVVPEFLRAALDLEESAHVDVDADAHQKLVVVDCPIETPPADPKDALSVQYETQPISLLFLPDRGIVVTVSVRSNPVVKMVIDDAVQPVDTSQRVQVLLAVLLRAARLYPGYLNNIARQFSRVDGKLRSSMKNAELIRLLDIQKSLVYFSTSLNSEKAVLDRIAAGKVFVMTDDEREQFNDVLVEIAQAMEMCKIYTDIVSNTMGAFGNVISNNMNSVMKALAIITVIMAIPNIVFGFYGMNTASLPLAGDWLYPLLMALAACAGALVICIRTGIFK